MTVLKTSEIYWTQFFHKTSIDFTQKIQFSCDFEQILLISFNLTSDFGGLAGHDIDFSWKFLLGKKIAHVWEEDESPSSTLRQLKKYWGPWDSWRPWDHCRV